MLSSVRGDDWRQFRGNESNGVAADSDRVTRPRGIAHRALERDRKHRLEADLPGRGPSSPIVVAGHVIVTARAVLPRIGCRCCRISAATGSSSGIGNFGRPVARWSSRRRPSPRRLPPATASVFALFSSGDLVGSRSRRQSALASRAAIRASGRGKRRRHGVVAGCRRPNGDRADREPGRFVRGGLRHGSAARPAGRSRGRGSAIGRRRSRFTARALADDLVLLQSTTGVSAHDPLTGDEQWSHKIGVQRYYVGGQPTATRVFVPDHGNSSSAARFAAATSRSPRGMLRS